MFNTKDILYLAFVFIITLYTVLNKYLKNKSNVNKLIFFIYIVSSVGIFVYTAYYLSESNKNEALLADTNLSATQQKIVLQTVVDNAIQEHKKLDNAILDAKTVASYIDQKISSLVENELVIKSFVIKTVYKFTSKDNINHISSPVGTRYAYLYDVNKTKNYLQLVAPWKMNYPNANTAEFVYEFTPQDQINILNKDISILEKYYYVSVPYSNKFYPEILSENGSLVDPIFQITIEIYINSKLYHKMIFNAKIDSKGNYFDCYAKEGLFHNAREKYIKLLKLPENPPVGQNFLSIK